MLVILVGQTVQTMQVVGWLPVTPVEGLELPYWAGVWFGVYPTWEGLPAQAAAAAFVVGSYVAAEALRKRKRARSSLATFEHPSRLAARPRCDRASSGRLSAMRPLHRRPLSRSGFRLAESRGDLPADFPGEVRELRFEELLPRERNGLRRAGDRDEHGAAVGAGGRAREHRG